MHVCTCRGQRTTLNAVSWVSLFYFLKGFIFIYVSVEYTLCFCGVYKGQKRMSDLLELESQVVVSHQALELGTVLGSSEERQMLLNL